MLELKDLYVKIEGQEVVKGVTQKFDVDEGKFFVLLGPNGCGKSTLFRAIMGFSKYKVKGDILLDGKKINGLDIDERVKLGLSYMYQSPPKIKGLTVRDMLEEKELHDDFWDEYSKDVDELDALKFYNRSINDGLSGGEIKRSELLTLAMIPESKIFLFDEPDSGVDLDNMKRLGKYVDKLVKQRKGIGIIVTHTGDMLKYLDVQKAIIMYNGKISCEGDPKELLDCVKKKGYEDCIKCQEKKV